MQDRWISTVYPTPHTMPTRRSSRSNSVSSSNSASSSGSDESNPNNRQRSPGRATRRRYTLPILRYSTKTVREPSNVAVLHPAVGRESVVGRGPVHDPVNIVAARGTERVTVPGALSIETSTETTKDDGLYFL